METNPDFRSKQIWNKIVSTNKFVLTSAVFVLWILFLDRNNFIERISSRDELKQVEKDKTYYSQKIKNDSIKLHDLKTDKENLEKFAREQYYLKKNNEDVFVIIEKEN